MLKEENDKHLKEHLAHEESHNQDHKDLSDKKTTSEKKLSSPKKTKTTVKKTPKAKIVSKIGTIIKFELNFNISKPLYVKNLVKS